MPGWGLVNLAGQVGQHQREVDNVIREVPRTGFGRNASADAEGVAQIIGSGANGEPFGVTTTKATFDLFFDTPKLRKVILVVTGAGSGWTVTINNGVRVVTESGGGGVYADFLLTPLSSLNDISVRVTGGSGTYTAVGWIEL